MASRAVSRSIQPPKVLPPPSPFGELLRRSNFASYDPAVRQTYTAPASYIHRGNWGLKRPIANRKRHSTIVLRNFEEHAHFIEWDKAPVQVDFIKRVEELNIQPTLADNSTWAHSLGPYADAIDSEFCPSEGLKRPRKPDLKVLAAHRPPTFKKGFDEQLLFLGNKGKGAYGANGVEPRAKGDAYIQPNIAAMTPQKFEDYLEELRELRPKFLEYIRQEIKETRGESDKHSQDPGSLKDEEIITKMSAEAAKKNLHRYFLGQHTQDTFDGYRAAATDANELERVKENPNALQPIQGQPHRLAGLIYSKPTMLETYYAGRAEPGLVLQETGDAHYHKSDIGYVAVFAGLAAKLEKKSAGNDVRALLDPFTEEGLNVPITPKASGTGSSVDLRETEHDMRMVELKLETPPKVVGVHVSNRSMIKVNVQAKVVVESAINHNWRTNPHKPGSMQFNAAMTASTKAQKPWSINSFGSNNSLARRAAERRVNFGSDPLAASDKRTKLNQLWI
ncbi:hypothetical protein BJ912DRAFT_846190 [Pholiota molesta]|nr:hypothetical protein BJ912DRAFT_846190 [Pholiota molesta]